MTLLALALGVLVQGKWITVSQIVVIAFLAGTTMALNAPTYQAAIRDLVDREDTLNAIALNSIQFNMSRVAGPSLAGFAIAGFGVVACFYLNALSYLPLLYVIWRVRFPAVHEREANSMREEMVEAFRYVWTHRSILVLVSIVAMVSMFGLPYLVMMPSFARDILNVGAKGLGYLVAASGTGALLGGIHLARRHSHRKRGPLVLRATVLFFTAILLFCFSRNPWMSALLLAIVGGAMVNSVATVNTLIQTMVPDRIRGRVLSMHTMAFLGFTPLGSLLVGSLAEYWTVPYALAVSSGFALVLTVVIVLAAPSVRHLH
jgi:MFS family permease